MYPLPAKTASVIRPGSCTAQSSCCQIMQPLTQLITLAVQAVTPWYFVILVKESKTDQFGWRTRVVLGVTGSDIRPVAALLDYLAVRGNGPGPLCLWAPFTPGLLFDRVQAALTAAGVRGSNFNGHSFRIEAATSANAAGLPEMTIKILGCWRSTAYQHYIQPSDPCWQQWQASSSHRE